jgi:hypothetical protein
MSEINEITGRKVNRGEKVIRGLECPVQKRDQEQTVIFME